MADANIRSSIGSRRVASTGAGRQFVVSDDSDFEPQEMTEEEKQANLREQAATARKAAITEANRVTPVAKRRIEMLLGMGRGETEARVEAGDGHEFVFSMRTLKGEEAKQLAKLGQELAVSQDTSRVWDIRATSLAYSIYKIDNVDFDVALECDDADYETKLDVRKDFIGQLDEAVLNYLYFEYTEMVKKNNEKFGIKTQKDAEEVAVDMKKSSEGV